MASPSKRNWPDRKEEMDESKLGKCIQGASLTEPPPLRPAGLTVAGRAVGAWRRARQ